MVQYLIRNYILLDKSSSSGPNVFVLYLLLALFLWRCIFEGVQSAELSYDDLKQQILNSGTVVFIDLLEKVRN